MIFWLCTVAYILVGIVVGRLAYNDCLDAAYEEQLFRADRLIDYSTNEEKQKWAYERAKEEDGPSFWGWAFGIGWGVILPFWLVGYGIYLAFKGIDKVLPKSKASLDMKELEAKKKLAAIEAEYQRQLKIVEDYPK